MRVRGVCRPLVKLFVHCALTTDVNSVEFNVFTERRSGRKGASKIALVKPAPGTVSINFLSPSRVQRFDRETPYADGRETGVVSTVNPNGFGFINCADSDPATRSSAAPAPTHGHGHGHHPQLFFHLSEV